MYELYYFVKLFVLYCLAYHVASHFIALILYDCMYCESNSVELQINVFIIIRIIIIIISII